MRAAMAICALTRSEETYTDRSMAHDRHRHRILLVEDDLDSRDIMATLLRRDEFAVFPASDGAEALDRLRENIRPCVILLDWRMPRVDGASFRRAQLADAESASIPVIALSAYAQAQEEAAALGITTFVAKPFDPGDFLRTVEHICARE
jgi:CheY-like chemotaxis protein